ncbi:MAG: response regulator [Gemmatimonadetes bacterium]|nr:response regulator [Gemmatimonadota bacterium]
MNGDQQKRCRDLEQEVLRLNKVQRSLMRRVERSMDMYNETFSLTQAAVLLEDKVRERTTELRTTLRDLERSNADFRSAKEAADAANRAKSEFLANMSHEIRTPMNGILGMTELLLGTNIDTRQKRFTEVIQRSGESLLKVINSILDFSKIEAGKLSLETIRFDLREVVEETCELLANSAHAKGIELLCVVPSSIPTQLVGDPVRLQQILSNLIGNAIKFTTKGWVLVQVSTAEQDDEKLSIRFDIRDTGIGMSEQALSRVFESFEQADGSTTRQYGGTGLGLPIARQLVEMMDGEIGVESEPGEGSQFWFTARFERQPSIYSSISLQQDDLVGARAIVLDTNAVRRQSIGNQVTAWGLDCTRTAKPEEALAAIRKAGAGGPMFLIVDEDLPDYIPARFMETVRNDDTVSDTPVILLRKSGARESDLREDSRLLFLSKPIRQRELLRTIRRLLDIERIELDLDDPMGDSNAANIPALSHHVLLAEDNPINQEVAVSTLEEWGCNVKIVEDGRGALDAFAQGTFDLILMDCQMPTLDGYGATKRIREHEANFADRKRTPVIALTANVSDTAKQRAFEAGMDDFISKPFSQEDLRRVLTKWLRGDLLPEGAGSAPHAEAAEGVDSGVIDTGAIDRLRSMQRPGGGNLVVRAIDYFLENAPEQMEQIRSAVLDGNPSQVEFYSHALKSDAANLGAERLRELLQELEDRAPMKNFPSMMELLPALQDQFDAAKRELLRIAEHS